LVITTLVKVVGLHLDVSVTQLAQHWRFLFHGTWLEKILYETSLVQSCCRFLLQTI